ncbi:MAG: DnaJ domain-containing protein [Beijerinckiaceae bacterium]
MLAIDSFQSPSRVHKLRQEELPPGIPDLLRVVAGDKSAVNEGVLLTGRSVETNRAAAEFFIENVLFWPDSDAYRILGSSPLAESGELRRNMALMIRWLHPDANAGEQKSANFLRVSEAWNRLKTQERRSEYDRYLLMNASVGAKRMRKYSVAGASRQGNNRLKFSEQGKGSLPRACSENLPPYAKWRRFFRSLYLHAIR